MSNMEELRREVEELKSIEREVKEKVSRAKENGERIDEHVNIWIEDANIIGKKAAKLLVDAKAKPKLLNKLLSCSRCSKKPTNDDIINSVKVVVEKGYDIFPAKGIELIWRDGFANFHSRKSTFSRIMESLKDDGVSIIGVSGLGGIGKTRLVTEIGKRAKDEKLFKVVLMATVSQEPDIRKIQGTLADMLEFDLKDDDDDDDDETSRANVLRSRLERKGRVLVILDDIWEVINMDSIGIPIYSNQKGCKIIVTSRRDSVCKDMLCNLVVPLDKILFEEAWDMFREYAGLNEKKSNSFMRMAKKITRKCGGLPLAIVVVGSALRGKDFEDYEDALERLYDSKFVNVESADFEIYSCLKLSYDYLKDEDAKKCFLLCSVFPEDSMIFAQKLVRYAYGQCMFPNVTSINEVKMRIFASIEKLEDAGLLSHVPRTRRHRKGDYFQTWPVLKMHDMVRDFALWITKDNDASSFVLTPKNEKRWMRNYKNATSMYLTRFSLNWENFPNIEKCPNLKMLILSSRLSMEAFEKYQGVFEVTSALQVLDVQSSSHINNILPPISLETLRNLRNLHLDGAAHSRSMEISMIGSLKNLEILELSLSLRQTVLPECIGELCNLRLLDLSRWYGLRLIPRNVLPKLTKLEELYTPAFHVPRHKCQWDTSFLSDLKFLPCLTAFAGQFMGFQTLPKDLRFGNLQSYYINCRPYHLKNEDIRWTKSLGLDECNELTEKMFSKLLPSVECLKIVGQLYIRAFQNLCPQIDTFGFQNLRELYLGCIYSLEYLIDTTGNGVGLPSLTAAFPNLVYLTLENITLLFKMCHGKLPSNYFSELKSAAIINCQKLKNIVPNMLPIGPKLEELKVGECYPMKYVYNLMEEESTQHTQMQLQSFPCPKVLELYDLYQLQSIWNMPPQLKFIDEHYQAELCKLVVRCLESLVTLKLHTSLELEEVFPCVELNQTSDAQFSNLTKLDLRCLPKLKCIWKGYQQCYSLQNMKRIVLADCDTLTNVFTSTHVRSLQKLRYLVIKNCDALEAIVTQDDQEEATIGLCHTSTSLLSFQEIKEIDISSCNKLKTILPISFVPTDLPRLRSISIEDCAELEQVFGDNHGQEIAAEGRQVVMNYLKTLTLKNLPSLVRFSPLNCSISVSSLSKTAEQDNNGDMDLLNFLPQDEDEPHTWMWEKGKEYISLE